MIQILSQRPCSLLKSCFKQLYTYPGHTVWKTPVQSVQKMTHAPGKVSSLVLRLVFDVTVWNSTGKSSESNHINSGSVLQMKKKNDWDVYWMYIWRCTLRSMILAIYLCFLVWLVHTQLWSRDCDTTTWHHYLGSQGPMCPHLLADCPPPVAQQKVTVYEQDWCVVQWCDWACRRLISLSAVCLW